MHKYPLAKIYLMSLISLFAISVSSAHAHPGVQILTAGNSKTRTAMTPGITYKEIGSVHLFTGKRALVGQEPVRAATSHQEASTITIIIKERPFRKIRHLRTQGFYNGNGPKSRRFTQGFYSGN